MTIPHSRTLLKKTAWRLRLISIARGTYRVMLFLCGLYALLLAVGKLLGVLPIAFEYWHLAVIPSVALLGGLLLHRRPTSLDAARRVDQSTGDKDLFLTVALLDRSPGDFKPLVAESAERRAPKISAKDVVPLGGGKRLVIAALAALILAGGIFAPVQLDPFGKVAAAEEDERIREQLQKETKATERRIAQIRKSREERKQSEVDEAINNLKTDFNQMKPKAKQANFNRLQQNQQNLGQNWRKLTEKELKELFNQSSSSQQFGGLNKDKLQKWTNELKKGETDSLQKEIADIKDELNKLEKIEDPAEKEKKRKEIRKRMQDLADFANEKVNSKPLSAAVERAMHQLEASQGDGLSSEALESVAQSLDLTEMELEEIAQSAEDLEALEQALKTLQMAKRLNEDEKLDGELCENCQSMADYEALYQQLLARTQGGGAFNGPGTGEGGVAPEDESTTTDFESEKVKSQIVAGKVLLSLKTKGLGDPNQAKIEYEQAMEEVRQGYSEAILQERIPPGYHEGIKKYFDSIEETSPELDE